MAAAGGQQADQQLAAPQQELGGRADPSRPRPRRSRHNLARLALRLRGRLAEMAAAGGQQSDKQLAARQQELEREAEQLRGLQSEVDGRFAELKQTAQELAAREAALSERQAETEAALKAARE